MFTHVIPHIIAVHLCLVFLAPNLASSQPAPLPLLTQKTVEGQREPAVVVPASALAIPVGTQTEASRNNCANVCSDRKAPELWFIYMVLTIVFFGILFSLLAVKVSLEKHTTWSLADALSEEADVTPESAVSPAGVLQAPPAAKMVITTLHASSSRLIAFLGSIVILFLFLGFGIVTLYDFATTGTLPSSMSGVKDYLLTGLALFAPYAVNKLSNLFEGLTPKKA